MTHELCPNCNTEVELSDEFKPQICPECGKFIVPCSLCFAIRETFTNCGKCVLEYQANKMNKLLKKHHEDFDTI